MQKYSANYGFFSSPLSGVAAYWAGFSAADGCIFRRRRGNNEEWLYQVKLSRECEPHLRQLQADLCYTGPIKYPVPDAASLVVYSKQLCSDLMHYGMRPNKTYVGLAPVNIPSSVALHFIQGVFDGNGSASKDQQGLKLSISGPAGLPQWCAAVMADCIPDIGQGGSTQVGPMSLKAWHGNLQVPSILKWLMQPTGAPRLVQKARKCRAILEVYH